MAAPVAVRDVELGRDDRRPGDEQLGEPVAADARQSEAAVGAGGRFDRRRQMVQAPPGALDAAGPCPVEPVR